MKFFKITNLEKVNSYLSVFVIFFLISNQIVIGSENKTKSLKSKNKDSGFEEVYFQNSIPFNSYDNFESQIKTFFGLYSYRSESSYYPDLSIINDSESLREIYKSKLKEMVINDIINNIHE